MSTLARNTRIWDHGKSNSFIPMSSQILNPIIEVLEISVIITGSVIILYPRTRHPISEPDDNKKSRAIPQPPFTTMKFAASIGICSFTASLVLLFVICQFQGKLWKLDTPIERAISRDQGHLHRQLKADVAHQELLAELYYQHQLRERNDLHFNSYRDIGANYPCIYGENPVGLDTHASVNDGHKYACGLLHIKSKPIIYSFGSNRQQDFEKSILSYRPDSLIYVFDIKASNLPPVTDRDPKITYTTLGLGPRVNITDEMYLVHEIMKSYNHTHVDLLKIDIEGSEYDWLKHEPADTFARIGQLLIEVHDIRFGTDNPHIPTHLTTIPETSLPKVTIPEIVAFFASLEARGLRIFHKEVNVGGKVEGVICCSEFSLIKHDWGSWNSNEKSSLKQL